MQQNLSANMSGRREYGENRTTRSLEDTARELRAELGAPEQRWWQNLPVDNFDLKIDEHGTRLASQRRLSEADRAMDAQLAEMKRIATS